MSATNQSRDEHKQLHRLEKIMYKCADELEKKKEIPISDLIRITTVIYEFVEGIHHKREENAYFTSIVNKDPSLKAETEKFTAEHQFGRNAAGQLSLHLIEWADGGKGGEKNRESLVRHLRTYAGYITPHLKQEDVFLNKVENSVIPKEEDAKMYEEFKSDSATNKHEELMIKQLDHLETRPWYID